MVGGTRFCTCDRIYLFNHESRINFWNNYTSSWHALVAFTSIVLLHTCFILLEFIYNFWYGYFQFDIQNKFLCFYGFIMLFINILVLIVVQHYCDCVSYTLPYSKSKYVEEKVQKMDVLFSKTVFTTRVQITKTDRIIYIFI